MVLRERSQSPRRGDARRARVITLVLIALGGALGAPARYEIAQIIRVPKDGFPWATFWTNLSGALVLGFFLTLIIERFHRSRYPRMFFAVGFLGAYTTFSTMAVETDLLAKNGHAATGIVYLLTSIVAGLAVCAGGIALARAITRSGAS
jgi:CrcB protein